MKFTPTAAIAAFAGQVMAQASCPATTLTTTTTTEAAAQVTSEVYLSTITVSAPATTTVTVDSNGNSSGGWQNWSASSSVSASSSTSTSLPAGCSPSVGTTTTTAFSTVVGSTTTITGSTLYVGIGTPQTTVTVTVPGAGNGADAQITSAAGSGSSLLGGSGNDLLGLNAGGNGMSVDIAGLSLGVEGGKVIATGADALKLTVPALPVITVPAAPQYTQDANGNYGVSWLSGSVGSLSTIVDGLSATTTGTGSAFPTTIPTGLFSNASSVVGALSATNTALPTTTSSLSTAPTPGSPGSNLTAAFQSLAETSCNDNSDRSKWCSGYDINTDYYTQTPPGQTKSFDFTITNTMLNMDGSLVPMLAINGQVPGPLIEANWGDTVQVTVHNAMVDNGTSIHWHGVRQMNTNNQDGVPGVTECPIAPGESRTYTWVASSYGTSWYHSHWNVQAGDGVLGPIVIHGPASASYDVDAGPVLLMDTFPDATATQQNWRQAFIGNLNADNVLFNGKNTKADLSAGQHAFWSVQKGKKYLFRMINGASQNSYSVSLDNHQMQVIAADFVPITPYQTEWLNIGIGQRYDVIIEMNQAVDSYFMRAVTQTGCPSGSINTGLGQANAVIAYEGVPTSPYLLPTSTTSKTPADFTICQDEPLASLVPVVQKDAGSSTAFSKVANLPAGLVSTISTTQGNFFRWFINNGAIDIDYTHPSIMTVQDQQNISSISNAIVLDQKNEWYYFAIQNQFTAAHPLHLHGHDFSLLGQGNGNFDGTADGLNFVNPARRDTAMLPASGYSIIGFQTDNPGAWLMHCHIAWHVNQGLGLQWVERPDDIAAAGFIDSNERQICSTYSTWQTASQEAPGFYESGLRKREATFSDYMMDQVSNRVNEMVRRSSESARRFLGAVQLKRGIGRSAHARK